jgi:lipoprotein-releasing system ATP-binding protein
MSGGQQLDRGGARTVAMDPDLVLAYQPTGNLDTKSADSVFELIRQVNRDKLHRLPARHPQLKPVRRRDSIMEVVDGRIQG